MITEDYVSFEVAKLLKEKGFDIPYNYRGVYINGVLLNPGDGYRFNYEDEIINVCSLQMAMKWLREVHHIFIRIIQSHIEYCTYELYWNNGKFYTPRISFDTYEEACEEAVKYCLKNLIKNEDEEEESDIPIPKTLDEAISTLEKILSDEDREYLLKNGAISMHDSLGRWIRNEWGLWTGSELKNELKKKGFEHPDDMSNYIIEEFIKYRNNKL